MIQGLSASFVAALGVLFTVWGTANAVTLKPGDIIVWPGGPDRVDVVDPETGVQTVISEGGFFHTIKDVAVSGTDKIYSLGQVRLPGGSFDTGVVEIDPATGQQRLVSSGENFSGFPSGIAVEPDGTILVSDRRCCNPGGFGGAVIQVNPLTGQQTVLSAGDRIVGSNGIAVGPNGDIFLATGIRFPAGVLPDERVLASGVLRIDPNTGQQMVVTFGADFDLPPIQRQDIISATDVAVDTDGTIYVMDVRFRGDNLEDEVRIIRVNPDTGEQTLLTRSIKGVDQAETNFSQRGFDIFTGVLFAIDYRLSETGLPGVSRFDPSVGFRVGVSSENFFQPSGLAVVQSGTLELSLTTNQATFEPGDSLTVSVGVDNPGIAAFLEALGVRQAPLPVDFYLGAVLPDGVTCVFFADLNFTTALRSCSSPATFPPIAAGVDLTTPFTFNQPAFFTFTWAGTEPAGSYVLFLAAVVSEALADGSIDAGDIVAVSTATVSFTSPLSVTPTGTVNFGTVTVGTSADRTFTIQNTGEDTLTGTASTSAPFSIVSGGSFSLAAGASQAVVVRFSPTSASTFVGNVTFTSNGGVVSSTVNGTGATPAAQVRFLNFLVICPCPPGTPFTARLTAEEGFTWLSTSGTFSAYQAVTTPTLSNFVADLIGSGVTVFFPATFPIEAGQRFALVLTLDAGNFILGLVPEGAVSASAPQQLGTPESVLPGRQQGGPAIRFAPAQEAPAFR